MFKSVLTKEAFRRTMIALGLVEYWKDIVSATAAYEGVQFVRPGKYYLHTNLLDNHFVIQIVKIKAASDLVDKKWVVHWSFIDAFTFNHKGELSWSHNGIPKSVSVPLDTQVIEITRQEVDNIHVLQDLDRQDIGPLFHNNQKIKALMNAKLKPLPQGPLSHEKLESLYDEIMAKARETFISKNMDYARSDDALAGFTALAKEVGITPEQVWSVFVKKHIKAIDAYIKGKTESEPIEMRVVDVINYMGLFYGLLKSK